MPAAHTEARNAPHLPLSSPIAWMCMLVAALMLWLSLSSCFDAIVVFDYATARQPGELKTVIFRIVEVSSRTPNFKVRFGNGATARLSFPDLLGGNPKGGLKMPQLTDHARELLKDCMATAQIKSVPSAFGRRDQVWDLACPQAHLHYGPEVVASEIRQHPRFDLAFSLVFSGLFLLGAFLMALLVRKFSEK